MVEQGTSRAWKPRLLGAIVIVVLLAIFVPPWINISHFRHGIVQSIGAGLGRTVHAQYVELQLFPEPGFVLHNFIVEEDPAFGAEPVLMAPSVTATLRASTLWHMRVEIAELRFDQPSLNLTRNATGKWNFEPILRRTSAAASNAQSAPFQAAPSRRASFPYVEATQARVNFKIGVEKRPFSLEDADLALWKEDGSWHVRLKARPVRTDLPVSDSGEVLAEGVLGVSSQAVALEDAPIHLKVEWRKAQLGDVSRLLRGQDDGWRGAVAWIAHANGTLSHALVTSDIEVDEFRRAEFIPAEEMDLSAHCKAEYVHATRSLDALECHAPLGSGEAVLRGAWSGTGREAGPLRLPAAISSGPLLDPRQPPLHLELRRVPAQFLLDLLRHVHPGIPADVAISGEVNGTAKCGFQSAARSAMPRGPCSGEFHSTVLALNHLSGMPRPLALSAFTLASAPPAPVSVKRGPRKPERRRKGASARESALDAATHSMMPGRPAWYLRDVDVPLGGAAPAILTGRVTRDGASLQLAGPAGLKTLAEVAQSLNIPAPSKEIVSISGDSHLTARFEMRWLPPENFSGAEVAGGNMAGANQSDAAGRASTWEGSLQLHNATVRLASLPGAVQLSAARVIFNPRQIQWTDMAGSYGHMPFDGSIQWQLQCPAAAGPSAATTCERTFALHTPLLSTAALWPALHPAGDSGLLALVDPWPGRIPAMPSVSGTVRADTLEAGRLSIRNAVVAVRIDGRSAQASSIAGEVFSGVLQGKGSVQWDSQPPSYVLDAGVKAMQPASAADLWHERWGRGVADLQVDLTTQGADARDLAKNAAGTFSLHWQHGGLAAPAFASTPLGRFESCQLAGKIEGQALRLSSGTLGRSAGRQYVTGTVTFGRALDLHLRPAGISVGGTVSEPVVHGVRGRKVLHIAERQSGAAAE